MSYRMIALMGLVLAGCAAQPQQQHIPTLRTAGDFANICRLDSRGEPVSPYLGYCMLYLRGFLAGYVTRKESDDHGMLTICPPKDEGWQKVLPKLVPALETADAHMAAELTRMNANLASMGIPPIAALERALDDGVLIALNNVYGCRPNTSVVGHAPGTDFGPWGAMKK